MSTLTLFDFNKAFQTINQASIVEKKSTQGAIQRIDTFSLSIPQLKGKEKLPSLRMNFNINFLKNNTSWGINSFFRVLNHPSYQSIIILEITNSSENSHKSNIDYKKTQENGQLARTNEPRSVSLKIYQTNLGKILTPGLKPVHAIEGKHFAIKDKTFIMIKMPEGSLAL